VLPCYNNSEKVIRAPNTYVLFLLGASIVTIALSINVNDGLVLAADSASTLVTQTPQGEPQVINVYNNANKIFNLRKGLPIGAMTWGAGNIGNASTSTLMKDLRRRLSGEDTSHSKHWKIGKTYTIENVANLVREYFFDELYLPAFKDAEKKPQIGFIVAGYSTDEPLADEYQIEIKDGECVGPRLMRPKGDPGITWSGQPEAISRLVLGFGTGLPTVLEQNLGVPTDQIPEVVRILQEKLTVPFVVAAMPFQDAIDLAEFLVNLTINFSRFAPGAQTVGGPLEIAAISKHEGFKWIRRKHYYSRDLNPEDDHGFTEHQQPAAQKHRR